MSASSLFQIFFAGVISLSAAEKPRIFITDSAALQVSADATTFVGGQSPQNLDVIKAFQKQCPAVIVTSNRDKAQYVVRLDHEAVNPATPFVHGNKVAIFDRNDDLFYSDSTHTLTSAVKGACAAITRKR